MKNSVFLEGPGIDDYHAVIKYNGKQMMLTDAVSTYGTFLNKFKPEVLFSGKKNLTLICNDFLFQLDYKKKVVVTKKDNTKTISEESVMFAGDNRNIDLLQSVQEDKFHNVNLRVTAIEPKAKKVGMTRYSSRNTFKVSIDEGDEGQGY